MILLVLISRKSYPAMRSYAIILTTVAVVTTILVGITAAKSKKASVETVGISKCQPF